MQSTITRIACELARTTDARRPVVGSTAGSVGRSRVMSSSPGEDVALRRRRHADSNPQAAMTMRAPSKCAASISVNTCESVVLPWPSWPSLLSPHE